MQSHSSPYGTEGYTKHLCNLKCSKPVLMDQSDIQSEHKESQILADPHAHPIDLFLLGLGLQCFWGHVDACSRGFRHGSHPQVGQNASHAQVRYLGTMEELTRPFRAERSR